VELVVLVGLQASGKSTFFHERFAGTHEHVSKDLFPHNRNKNNRQEHLLRAALSAGRSVVVDNTNPTLEDRWPLVRLGHEYEAKVVGYFFEVSVRECLRRNAKRKGKARVPDVAIYATAKKLVTPSIKEGFDELHLIRRGGAVFETQRL
jgi:predicted kinase